MKKIISLVLTALMLLSAVSVCADTETSSAMQTALVAVKQKIDIPSELSEFSSSSREYNGVLTYSFHWTSEDGDSYILVDCDSIGRISSYHYYDEAIYSSDRLFTDISKEEIIAFADGFIRRIAPEAFANADDILVLDDENIPNGGLTYYVSYDRYKNGSLVKDNTSAVTVRILDEKMLVSNATIGFDYLKEFEEPKTEIANYKEKYIEAFPIELIYRNKDRYKYTPHNLDEKDEIILEYRIKDNSLGYISAETGELVTEDARLYASGGGSGGSADNENAADSLTGSQLTEKELEELGNIEGLLSKDDIVSFLESLPSVEFDDDMKLESYRITKDDKDKYYIAACYNNSKEKDASRRINVRLEGMNGKLLSLSNYSYYDTETKIAAQAQKDKAANDIKSFTSAVAEDELLTMKEKSSEWYKNELSKSYVRMVNDIEYIDNTMNIAYDAYTGRIERYNLNYDNELDFVSPDGAISASEAYEAMLKAAPLERVYIISDGKYKPCYALSEFGAEIDAFTGERIKSPYDEDEHKYEYDDISDHWSREAVEKLASVNIGLEGDSFNPDSPITQSELLRLFSAGVHYTSYLDYDEEELYRRMEDLGIISDTERAPSATPKREDAFVYLIRLAKLDKIAEAEDIFKLSYADGELISAGKLGYAAILTGLDVICGNGGYIRPDDIITRAEAAAMLYKYMLNAK